MALSQESLSALPLGARTEKTLHLHKTESCPQHNDILTGKLWPIMRKSKVGGVFPKAPFSSYHGLLQTPTSNQWSERYNVFLQADVIKTWRFSFSLPNSANYEIYPFLFFFFQVSCHGKTELSCQSLNNIFTVIDILTMTGYIKIMT